MRVVATAGHVDHGKSSLVRALTGTDPDRWAEEKERGLTIDLGFAFTTLPSGAEIGFVDVPGHVRFVKNMLAGVGAVEVAVLVVSAGEGWMPQSEEHLEILELLGIEDGIAVVTQADTVGPDELGVAMLEVEERLARSSWRDVAVVVCDSVSGRGLDDVRAALDDVLAATPGVADHGRPRLWVDRVFAARGAGTVVTGTLTGGSLARDDEVVVAATGASARVRGIESAHRRTDEIGPGARVALNLAGIDHHALARGDAIVRAGDWSRATAVDVRLTSIDGAAFTRARRLHAYVGSGEHPVRLRPLGDGTYARIRSTTPLPLAPGDRMVLRDSGTAATVAGAIVLDSEPATRPADAPVVLDRPLGPRLLAATGWIARADLPRRAGLSAVESDALADELVRNGDATALGAWLVSPRALAEVRDRAVARVQQHQEAHPLDPGMELSALATSLKLDTERARIALADEPRLVVEHGRVRDAARAGRVADGEAGRALVAELDASPFAPEPPSDTALARALVREGVLVDVDGIVFTARAVDAARDLVAAAFARQDELTIADVRELLGSTRKYVVPLLTQFDREGLTRRRGDVRVAGPRAGQR